MIRSKLPLLLLALPACQSFSQAPPPAWGGAQRPPEPAPGFVAPAPLPGPAAADAPAASFGLLKLEEALRLAGQHAPELGAGADELHAAEARLEAAGRLPDPELSVGVEAVPFRTPRGGDELLVGASQEIPLSGTGAAARGAAEATRELSRLRLEALRIRLETRVRAAFGQALAAQQADEQLQRRQEISAELLALAAARVDHGDLLPSALRALQAEAAVQAREQRGAGLVLESSKRTLEALIGAADGAIGRLEGELAATLGLPQLEALLSDPAALPAAAGARAEAELARWRAQLAEARTVPSIELGLAYRRRGDGRDSFDAGLVLGLPITGGRAAEARATRFEESAARQRAAAVERDSAAAFRQALAAAQNALAWLELYQDELLPSAAAQGAVAGARFEAGDLSRAELLAVQAELARLRLDRLDAFEDLLVAWGELRASLTAVAD
ncbi:MAG: TolC family protein [Planctomycetes bacterium]|nr:TolC family protein [Planctomycetota bacterium]